MFSVRKNGKNRLDINMSCKLNADSMSDVIDEMATKSSNIKNGVMLYTIKDLQLPTLGAIGVEISRLPTLLRLIKKFDRAAVLTNKNWIKKLSAIEGALMPGLEIKSFNLEEEKEAIDWLYD